MFASLLVRLLAAAPLAPLPPLAPPPAAPEGARLDADTYPPACPRCPRGSVWVIGIPPAFNDSYAICSYFCNDNSTCPPPPLRTPARAACDASAWSPDPYKPTVVPHGSVLVLSEWWRTVEYKGVCMLRCSVDADCPDHAACITEYRRRSGLPQLVADRVCMYAD